MYSAYLSKRHGALARGPVFLGVAAEGVGAKACESRPLLRLKGTLRHLHIPFIYAKLEEEESTPKWFRRRSTLPQEEGQGLLHSIVAQPHPHGLGHCTLGVLSPYVIIPEKPWDVNWFFLTL
jgi:hypothetical protein